MTAPEYLPGDNLPLPSTPPQEPCGTFSSAMHTRWPTTDYGYNPASGALRASAEAVHTHYPACQCQPPDDALRPAQGILYAALAAALLWLAVVCLVAPL